MFLRYQTLFLGLFRCQTFRLSLLAGNLLCGDTITFRLLTCLHFGFCFLFGGKAFTLRLSAYFLILGFHFGGCFLSGYLGYFPHRGRESNDDDVTQGFSVLIRVGHIEGLVGNEMRLLYLAAHN